MKITFRNGWDSRKLENGFSLIELMIVLLLLTIIMAAVFSQIDLVQKRFRTEESKLDISQTSREFMDQMVRDIHQTGFPNLKMYSTGVVAGDGSISSSVAAGLIYISPTSIRIEADVDGDGNVDAVAYTLITDTTAAGNENCPCIRRSQLRKADGVTPINQSVDYRTQVENLSATNTNIFQAFNKTGASVDLGTGLTKTVFDPADTTDATNTIYTIQITLNVQGASTDLQTRTRPVSVLKSSVQIKNYY